MKQVSSLSLVAILLVLLGNGCQVVKTGTETRMDEQMLDISYENAKKKIGGHLTYFQSSGVPCTPYPTIDLCHTYGINS
ncbi:hypothetical protein ACFL3Q_16705 [Planctomycetota bacterium]